MFWQKKIIQSRELQRKDWVFDNQKIRRDEDALTQEKLEEVLKKHLDKVENTKENYYVEVAFLGTDFTNLEEQLQEDLLQLLQKYIRMERIDGIRVSIRPENITKKK